MGWPETPAPLPARIASRNVNTQVDNVEEVDEDRDEDDEQVVLDRSPRSESRNGCASIQARVPQQCKSRMGSYGRSNAGSSEVWV